MKRALVLRAACAIIGTAFSVLACSSSNPTLPPGVTPLDSGPSERGISHTPDAPTPTVTEAGGGALDAKDVARTQDVPFIDSATGIDAATGAIDSAPVSRVTVSILDPVAVSADAESCTLPTPCPTPHLTWPRWPEEPTTRAMWRV